jgi:hypothetical protein
VDKFQTKTTVAKKGMELHNLWGGSGHGLLSNIGAKILDLAERDPEKAASYGFHLDSE